VGNAGKLEMGFMGGWKEGNKLTDKEFRRGYCKYLEATWRTAVGLKEKIERCMKLRGENKVKSPSSRSAFKGIKYRYDKDAYDCRNNAFWGDEGGNSISKLEVPSGR
jgi:hypothetical protein